MAGIGDYVKGKSFSEAFKKKSPLAWDWRKTKIKDIDKSKKKFKIGRRRGDTNVRMSLISFGGRK